MSAPKYSGTIERHRLQYDRQVNEQQISPFIIPNDFINYVLLVFYLVTAQKLGVIYKALTLISIAMYSISSLLTSRTLGLAQGILVGISNAWCILISINLLCLSRPQQDFKRKIASNSLVRHNRLHKKPAVQWQRMPSSVITRLFWTLDLLGSLRALHWSVRQPGHSIPDNLHIEGQRHEYSLKRNLGKLLLIYLSIDILKEVIAFDPYFWGYTEYEPPDYVLFSLRYSGFIQAYRMLVAFAVLSVGVELISTAGVILFVDILGPPIAGSWGHSWAYERQFGCFDSVCTKGLRGFWGEWWHQMFRIALNVPANALLDSQRIQRKSIIGKSIMLVAAFLISGIVHACGSYTMWGQSQPLHAFLFFALQPIGITTQILGSWTAHQILRKDALCPDLCKAANTMFTVTWLLSTFPLLADDFAHGGFWLTEPFPISVIQMLGIGGQARSQQLWSSYGAQLYKGRRWWQMGISV
ncbi:hypothetical protein ACLMJK_002367 [Lecanora helva]